MPSADEKDSRRVYRGERRLRVAHVGPDPHGRGGMAAVTTFLLTSELAQRHELEVIVTHRTGSRVKRVVTFLRALVRLAVWCRRPGERVVHVHAAVRGSLVRKAICVVMVRALRRPVLLHVHAGAAEVDAEGDRANGTRTRALARALASATTTVAVSGATARALERTFGLREVGVVPNPAPAPVNGSEHDQGGPVRALYLGGFEDPVKGGAVLVRALADLPETLELVLAGPGVPPPELESRRGGSVRWAGWLSGSEKDRALAESDILVLPSLSEGLPLALLEGLANGMAVVASRVGGIPEVVVDEKEGLLVHPGDPRALAAALTRVAGDGDLRRRLGEGARGRVSRLTAAEVVDSLDERYRALVERPPSSASLPAAPKRMRNRAPDVAFLSYHSIADDGPPFLSLPVTTFERQLERLRARGYRSGGHAELRRLAEGEALPSRTVFLTFDDGYRDTYEVARPLLEAHGFRAIVFVMPGVLSDGGALDWPEVEVAARRWPGVMRAMTWDMAEEMAAAGHEFGAHTLSHPRLTEVDDDRLTLELEESRARVAGRLGACASVAYPFGDCDPRVISAAAEAGFEFGFSLPFGAQRGATQLSIPRVNVDHRDAGLRFSLKLTGLGRRLLLSSVKPALRRALRRELAPTLRYVSPGSP